MCIYLIVMACVDNLKNILIHICVYLIMFNNINNIMITSIEVISLHLFSISALGAVLQ